jgi:hypothetical protein
MFIQKFVRPGPFVVLEKKRKKKLKQIYILTRNLTLGRWQIRYMGYHDTTDNNSNINVDYNNIEKAQTTGTRETSSVPERLRCPIT